MTRSASWLLTASLPLAIAGPASAIEIAYAGQTFDNQDLQQWRTAAEAKTLDLDGDDVYGSAGYLMIGTATNGTGGFQQAFPSGDGAYTLNQDNLETLRDLPSGVTVTNGFLPVNQVVSGDFYAPLDDPDGGPDRRIGFALHNRFDQSDDALQGIITEFEIGATTPGAGVAGAVMRLGVALSNDPNITVSDFVGVESSSGGVSTGLQENFAGDFGQTVMFFDVMDYVAGDLVQIRLAGRDDDGRTSVAYSGATFDIVVPEPSSLLLLSPVAALALRRRR